MAEQIFSWILDKGASILSDDQEENSDILLKAIKDGDLNIVNLTLGVVSDMNKMKFEGESLLSIAAYSGQAAVAKVLVSKGADIEGMDTDGQTPLHIASREGHLDVVRFLVSKGGDVNRQTYDGMTPLAMAAKRGHLDVLKFIVGQDVEIDKADKGGRSPLLWASARGHLSTVNYLLRVRADPNSAKKNGWTSMHYSIFYDHLDVLKSLVNAGADVNRPDQDGTTPLHVACYNGRIQMLKYLLSNGADLHKTEFDGTSVLHSAASQGHQTIVSYILRQKEGRELVNRPDARGETPLHVATSEGSTSIIDVLVSNGGDLNAQTYGGQTCLHLAATELCSGKGSTEIEVTKELSKLMTGSSKDTLAPVEAFMKHLIQKGADVNIPDKASKNPLDYLSRRMAKLLVGEQSRVQDGRPPGGGKVDQKVKRKAGSSRSSSILNEEVLYCLSEDIPNELVLALGLKLGIAQAKVKRFEQTNHKGSEVTSLGTNAMLYHWFNSTSGEEGLPTLKRALQKAGLARLAEEYLPEGKTN
ncbi:ankyrin-3-like [Lytechinus variegatus]|uniref:ankyrin-3-like n=1 Tax=Lytechinus variegatus TaxID=7654 RepID=UPI001BB0D883|nr:ankyrin-3-like [Lytechinus variegatus]